MKDLVNVRCWFVMPRYTYRGLVIRVEGSMAVLNDPSKVVDLGMGKTPPKEEIDLPDGWRVDLAACEAFGPEPKSWTKR